MTSLIAPNRSLALTPDRFVPPQIEDSEHEIVIGTIVEPRLMGVWVCYVATKILALFVLFLEQNKAGRAISENLFILRRDPLLRRKPDAAFVSASRWAFDRAIPRGEVAWDVIPDIVVEVVSPIDLASEMNGKIGEHRTAGVRRIWVDYPEQTEIVEYLPDRTARIYGPGAVIDGGEVLPGFSLAINEVFELDEGRTGPAGVSLTPPAIRTEEVSDGRDSTGGTGRFRPHG